MTFEWPSKNAFINLVSWSSKTNDEMGSGGRQSITAYEDIFFDRQDALANISELEIPGQSGVTPSSSYLVTLLLEADGRWRAVQLSRHEKSHSISPAPNPAQDRHKDRLYSQRQSI